MYRSDHGPGLWQAPLRAAFLVIAAFWGIGLAACDIRTGQIGASVMHLLLIPIHEAGHLLFSPFGQTLTILGGSLMQVVLPLFLCGAFVVRKADSYGAGLCLWWAGASMLDLSPYIYDALHPALLLLSGHTGATDGGHDWVNLLGTWGLRAYAQELARAAWVAGVLWMQGGILWAAWSIDAITMPAHATTPIDRPISQADGYP
jgi:hypothetical protein